MFSRAPRYPHSGSVRANPHTRASPSNALAEPRLGMTAPNSDSNSREVKPFEAKAMRLVAQLEKLGAELTEAGVSPERADLLRKRIGDLNRGMEWLLGGGYEQHVKLLMREVSKHALVAAGKGADQQIVFYRLMRSCKGAPSPRAFAPPVALAPGRAGAQRHPLLFPISAEVTGAYQLYLASVTDPLTLVKGLSESLPPSPELERVYEHARNHRHAALCQGMAHTLALHQGLSSFEGRSRIVTSSREESLQVMAALESALPLIQAAGLRALSRLMITSPALRVDPKIEFALISSAAHPERQVRVAAISGLLTQGSRPCQKAAERLMRTPDPLAQAEGFETARVLKSASVEAIALESFESRSTELDIREYDCARLCAADYLRDSQSSRRGRLVRRLQQPLEEGNHGVAAARALANSPERTSQEALFAALKAGPDEVADEAAKSLARTSPQLVRKELLAAASSGETPWQQRKLTIRAIGPRTDRTEQQLLLRLLTEEDGLYASEAADTLACAHTCLVRPELVRHLDQSFSIQNPLIAQASVIAIGRVRTVEERALVLRALGHSFSVVRQAAAEVLLKSGCEAVDRPEYIMRLAEEASRAVAQSLLRPEAFGEALAAFYREGGLIA